MNDVMDVFIQLAFELGRAYERLYIDLDLYNVINVKDMQYAKSLDAEFKFKGDMSNLAELFTTHINSNIDQIKLNELNKLADDLKKVKGFADKYLLEKMEGNVNGDSRIKSRLSA